MGYSDKINALVHPLMIRVVRNAYIRKMDRRAKKFPELFRPVNEDLRCKHLALWSKLKLPCSDRWLRFFTNLTGIPDYRYVPEDLYFSRVERILNDMNRSGNECEDKNLIGLYVGNDVAPRTFVRYVRGAFFDGEGNGITEKSASNILATDNGELIGKACVATCGGHDVDGYRYNAQKHAYFSKNGNELSVDFIKKTSHSFVVQERIQQCDFEAQFNPASTNTFRIATLRRPWDGKVIVLKTGMRMGINDAVVDNLSSGGICVAIDRQGEIDNHAYAWLDFKEFDEHPTSHIKFGGMKFPYYDKAVAKITELARRNPNMNIMTWDIVIDRDENVRILEINASSISFDWMQFNFGSFFGDDTEAVVDWCASHLGMDEYKHFRSFYW